MKFTFGIITAGNDININKISNSIRNLKIPTYEILIIGKAKNAEDTRVIKFDESIKPKWITKKKNLIIENAKYENIVFLHDYVSFDKNWYKGFKKFGNDFNVCSNIILDTLDQRYRDWILEERFGENCGGLLPYYINASPLMYISGTYWVAKKKVMQEFKLNENLCWGEGEDIEWSHRVREKYNFSFNQNSINRLLKQPHNRSLCVNDKVVKIILNMSREEMKTIAVKTHTKHLPKWIRDKL